ncbi:MAG: hypothetical protein V2A73_20085 [Pseudomonadota bacterium]
MRRSSSIAIPVALTGLVTIGCQGIAPEYSPTVEPEDIQVPMTNSVAETGFPSVGLLKRNHPVKGYWPHCTGTLIRNPAVPGSNVYVLLAAHCIQDINPLTQAKVNLNPADFLFEIAGNSYGVQSLHPNANWVTAAELATAGERGINDIGIIRLASPVIGVTELNYATTIPIVNDTLKLVGFGYRYDDAGLTASTYECQIPATDSAVFCDYIWSNSECQALMPDGKGIKARYCVSQTACTLAEKDVFMADCQALSSGARCQDACIPGYPTVRDCGTLVYGQYQGCTFDYYNAAGFKTKLQATAAGAPPALTYYPTGTTQWDVCESKWHKDHCIGSKRSGASAVGYVWTSDPTQASQQSVPNGLFFAFNGQNGKSTLCGGDSGGPAFLTADPATVMGVASSLYWGGSNQTNALSQCPDWEKMTSVGFHGLGSTTSCTLDSDCCQGLTADACKYLKTPFCSGGVCKGFITV